MLLATLSTSIFAGNSALANKPSLPAISKGGILSEQPLNQKKETAQGKDSQKSEEEKDPLSPQQKVELCLMSGIGVLVLAAFVFTAVLKNINTKAPVGNR